MPLNEESVLEAIKNRDEAAIARVIRAYSRLLWSVAGAVLRNIGSEQDAEECVADAFITLWEHPEKFDPARGRLKTWLAMVARSRALDRCREIAKRSTVSLEETVLTDQMGLVDGIVRQETVRVLLAAIDALGEPDREILLRRYYYDQKPREIALALDLTVKQVGNHLYRTKRKLREAAAQ